MTNHPNRGKRFSVKFADDPRRNFAFAVRGICKFDVLNPYWDGRKDDVPGMHWSGECPACEPCTRAALACQAA